MNCVLVMIYLVSIAFVSMEAPYNGAVVFDTLYDEHKSVKKDHLKEAVYAVLEDKDVRSIEIPGQIKPSLTRTSRSALRPPRSQASGHSEIDMSYGFSEVMVRSYRVSTYTMVTISE